VEGGGYADLLRLSRGKFLECVGRSHHKSPDHKNDMSFHGNDVEFVAVATGAPLGFNYSECTLFIDPAAPHPDLTLFVLPPGANAVAVPVRAREGRKKKSAARMTSEAAQSGSPCPSYVNRYDMHLVVHDRKTGELRQVHLNLGLLVLCAAQPDKAHWCTVERAFTAASEVPSCCAATVTDRSFLAHMHHRPDMRRCEKCAASNLVHAQMPEYFAHAQGKHGFTRLHAPARSADHPLGRNRPANRSAPGTTAF
jgi:hypothetical protein